MPEFPEDPDVGGSSPGSGKNSSGTALSGSSLTDTTPGLISPRQVTEIVRIVAPLVFDELPSRFNGGLVDGISFPSSGLTDAGGGGLEWIDTGALIYSHGASGITIVDELKAGSILIGGTNPLSHPFVTIGNVSSLTGERALTGTSNQIVVTDNGADSSVVLSLPQSIHTAATPTFSNLTLSARTSGRVAYFGAAGVFTDSANLTFDGSSLQTTGNYRNTTYLRVGSLTAPANTTAGDLTCIRLVLGNTALGASAGNFIRTDNNLTATAAGADVAYFFRPVVKPASNSSADFRALVFQQSIAAATGITSATVQGALYEVRMHQDGAVTTINAQNISALIIDSLTPATAGTVTTANGVVVSPFSRPSGTSVISVSTLNGLKIAAITNAGATITAMNGVLVQDPTASTITTLKGLNLEDMTRGSTNYAIYIEGAVAGIGGGITWAGDTSIWRDSANVLALGSGDSLKITAANIITDTTTGMQIGTLGGASGQKLSFYGSAPIVQPVLATGAGNTVDQVITVLQNLGLVRQS